MGGPRRLRHTIPPIAFAALHIARKRAATGSGQPSAQEVESSNTHTDTAKDLLVEGV